MIHHGDLFDVLPTLADASIDACVTDAPYELGFMGKRWDRSGVAFDMATWAAIGRVLKPGAHLVSFGGTRTFHRVTVAIEDAGFEIRDCLSWLYGSGFPKSLNLPGGLGTALKPSWEPIVLARKPTQGTVAQNVQTHGTAALNIQACRIGTDDTRRVKEGGSGQFPHDDVARTPKTVTVGSDSGRWPANVLLDEDTAAALDAQTGELVSGSGDKGNKAVGSQGYGSNVRAWDSAEYAGNSGGASRFFYVARNGCALCCLPCAERDTMSWCETISASSAARRSELTRQMIGSIAPFAAPVSLAEQLALAAPCAENLCERCVTCIALALAETKYSGSPQQALRVFQGSMPSSKNSILIQNLASFAALWGNIDTTPTTQNLSMLFGSVLHAIENYTKQESLKSANGPSRFLYSAKPSRAERDSGCHELEPKQRDESRKDGNPGGDNPRNRGVQRRGNSHPTVKPIDLMRWLVRLVTPIDGTVLDPFTGSGTTGCACAFEGRKFIGIEREADYIQIAERRIAACVPLFGEASV